MTINSEIFETFSVIQIKAYLEATGWKVQEKYSDKGLLFSNPDETLKTLLPLKQHFADYTLRLSEIVRTLSNYEDRSIENIIRDIQLSGFDVFRVRLISNARDGTIPLSSTEPIIEKARKMLSPSASSVIKPRKVHSARKGKQVEEYMDKVRLGHTEYGSYIFTLLTPVAPEINPTLPLPFEEPISETTDPFDRQVTTKLSQGINATHYTALQILSGEDASFDNVVEQGVSAELCESLSGITKESGSAEFSVSWAKTRPVSRRSETVKVEFTQKTADIVEEAARIFKLKEPETDLLVKGYVSHLSKDKMDPTGNIVVKGFIDGAPASVRLTLNDREYAEAIKAHDGFKTIVVEGDLIKRGKYRVLEKIRNFHIDQNENDD